MLLDTLTLDSVMVLLAFELKDISLCKTAHALQEFSCPEQGPLSATSRSHCNNSRCLSISKTAPSAFHRVVQLTCV